MPSAATFFTVVAGIIAVIAASVYLFGIPPAWKRAAEEKALDTMGENKASYVLKGESSLATLCLCVTDQSRQIKSTKSQLPTRRTSSKSSRVSVTSWEGRCRTLLERRAAMLWTA